MGGLKKKLQALEPLTLTGRDHAPRTCIGSGHTTDGTYNFLKVLCPHLVGTTSRRYKSEGYLYWVDDRAWRILLANPKINEAISIAYADDNYRGL